MPPTVIPRTKLWYVWNALMQFTFMNRCFWWGSGVHYGRKKPDSNSFHLLRLSFRLRLPFALHLCRLVCFFRFCGVGFQKAGARTERLAPGSLPFGFSAFWVNGVSGAFFFNCPLEIDCWERLCPNALPTEEFGARLAKPNIPRNPENKTYRNAFTFFLIPFKPREFLDGCIAVHPNVRYNWCLRKIYMCWC